MGKYTEQRTHGDSAIGSLLGSRKYLRLVTSSSAAYIGASSDSLGGLARSSAF